MDYSFFDSLIDAVFIIDEERKILYCNNSAAALCNSSIRRLSKGVRIFEAIIFSDKDLFCSANGERGKLAPEPFSEIDYSLPSGDKVGKVQVAIQPFDEGGQARWAVMVHDVTLEETLHTKYRGELEQKEEYINQLRKAQSELENYSKNLEKMVAERTRDLNEANKMLNAIMDSLGQGFLVFDVNGVCGKIHTKACESILEVNPSGKNMKDVLRLTSAESEAFAKWCGATFAESLPFETIRDLAPHLYPHSQGNRITLDYYPIRDDANKISNLVLVATDKTAEHMANLALEKERQHALMIVKAAKAKDQFRNFILSFEQTLSTCTELLEKAKETHQLDYQHTFRVLHTLEGEAGAFGVMSLRSVSREAQELLEPLKHGAVVDMEVLLQQFTQALQKLDKTYRNFLTENKELFDALGFGGEKTIEVPVVYVHKFYNKLLTRPDSSELSAEYSDYFLTASLKKSLSYYEEVAQMIAEKLNKKLAPFEFVGDARVLPKRFEGLVSAMVHCFRNAVDHGIEPPEEREFCGKPAEGHIKVQIETVLKGSDSWIHLTVEDDGGGIDPSRIKKKFREKFPAVNIDNHDDFMIQQLIFYPGFSSKDELGDFSGRGIGMDAIFNEVKSMGGQTRVESEAGRGTKLIIEVPLSEISQKMAIGA